MQRWQLEKNERKWCYQVDLNTFEFDTVSSCSSSREKAHGIGVNVQYGQVARFTQKLVLLSQHAVLIGQSEVFAIHLDRGYRNLLDQKKKNPHSYVLLFFPLFSGTLSYFAKSTRINIGRLIDSRSILLSRWLNEIVHKRIRKSWNIHAKLIFTF